MAKSARKGDVNPRSRAAKRATSPSINVDKSIKQTPRATDATPVLAAIRHGGIFKKKKTKHMTRGQKVRQEKGLSRAEAVMDQMTKKLEVAKSRKTKIDKRRGGWEDINTSSKNAAQNSVSDAQQKALDDEWEDVDEPGSNDVHMSAVKPSAAIPNQQTINLSKPPSLQDEVDLIG